MARMIFFLLAAGMILTSAASAELILGEVNVDPSTKPYDGSVATVLAGAGAYWNPLNNTSGASYGPLMSADGIFQTSVRLSYVSGKQGQWNYDGSNAFFGQGWGQAASQTNVQKLSGLQANSPYTLILYGVAHDPKTPYYKDVAQFIINGVTKACTLAEPVLPLSGGEYVTFTGNADANGEIVFSYNGNPDYYVATGRDKGVLVAFELECSPVAVFPTSPVSLTTGAITYEHVSLDWDNNPTVHNVVSYNIYRKESQNAEYIKIGSSTTSNYDDTGVSFKDCVNYNYAVTAVNTQNAESLMCGPVQVVVPCQGDADGDSIVDIDDMSRLASEWLEGVGFLYADFDNSGKVNIEDIAIMAAGWKNERPLYGHPNIVWIMGEDCSKHWYDLFDSQYGVSTPNIDTLADSGLRFNNTFCNVAVCSAARSTLISGCYPSRIGVQWHRKTTSVNLPEGLLAFPAYLRQAGYYTTNSTKTDYNCKVSGVWDKSSSGEFGWRNRPSEETPFFHVRTYTLSHESVIQTSGEVSNPTTNPASVNLYPVHPDTPLFRNTYATYCDKIKTLDNRVGGIINALQEDNLLDDTFIFFIGDNGGTVAGSKGYITNTGLHVPLVVYVPPKWQHLSPAASGVQIDGFVGFEDFAATVLNLAGVEIPDQMDGQPFMGQGVSLLKLNARDEAFCSADRFDEMYNLCRSLQKGDFKYVRNYEPFYPYALFNNYRYIMAAMKEWKAKFDAGQLNTQQASFFLPRAGEELYNIAVDPFETNNLADDPAYAALLTQLRDRLYETVTGMPDLGIIPEAIFLSEGGAANPTGFGQTHKMRIKRYVDIADMMLKPYSEVSAQLAVSLGSSDPLDRFWTLTVCAAFGNEAGAMETDITDLVSNENNPFVLARAAAFLGQIGVSGDVVEGALKKAVINCADKTESLAVLNNAVYLQDTLGYSFTSIPKSAVVGSSDWLNKRISHLGW